MIKKIEVALKKLSYANGMNHQLYVIYDHCVGLGKYIGYIQDKIWPLFYHYHKDDFKIFHLNPDILQTCTHS